MTPEEKRNVMSVKARFPSFSPECVLALHKECHIEMKEMQNLRVCIECAIKEPSQLEMGVPTNEALAESEVIPAVVREAESQRASINEGLTNFLCKLPDATPEEQFAHNIKRRMQSAPVPGASSIHSPSKYLDLSVTEFNREVLETTEKLVLGVGGPQRRDILKDACGERATEKLAKRKKDQYGYIRAHSRVANDKEALEKMKNQFDLAASIAEISSRQKEDKEKDVEDRRRDLLSGAPAAVEKLKAVSLDVKKLKKEEIASILLLCFGVVEDPKKSKKPALVAALETKIGEDASCLDRQEVA